MTSLTKNPKPKTKKFFLIANWKNCQVFWAFEQFSNTFSAGVMPVQTMCEKPIFARTAWINPTANVLIAQLHTQPIYSYN